MCHAKNIVAQDRKKSEQDERPSPKTYKCGKKEVEEVISMSRLIRLGVSS